MSAAGGAGPGVSLADLEAGARALARLQVERNMSEAEQRDAARVDRCVDAAWPNWTEEALRVLEAAEQARAAAPGPDRGDAERLTIREAQYRDRCTDLEREVAAAEARAERAVAVLRTLEWAGADWVAPGSGRLCPVCGGEPGVKAYGDRDHAPDCALAAQLGGPAREGCRSAAKLQERPETAGGAGAADPAAAGRAAVRRETFGAALDETTDAIAGVRRALTHKEQP